MDENVEREIKALRRSVNELGERLGKLERMVAPVPEPQETAPTSEPPVVTPEISLTTEPSPGVDVAAIEPQPIEQTPVSDRLPADKVAAEPAPPPPKASAKDPDQSLETRIGLYWLNRIGVASLVVGVALLILYSFQYFGAVAKLATGMSIAAALIVLGERLGSGRVPSWFGQGLIGGGWSLAYFTIYAMHFVDSVRVVESQTADAMLLLAVAGGAMAHAVYRQAEIIAVLAVVLGFTTVPLGGGALSPIASTVLACSAAVLAARLKWQRLFLWGVVAAYLSGMAASSGPPADGEPLAWLEHRLAHFGTFWFAFMAALFFAREDEPGDRQRLVLGTFVNALGFFAAMYSPVQAILHGNLYWFALGLGCAYGLSFVELKRRSLNAVATTHLVIGLALVTAAVPMAVASKWYVCPWTIEVAALAFVGLKFGIRSMRWFALGLSLLTGLGIFVSLFDDAVVTLMGLSIPAKCVMTLIGAVSFGLAAGFHRSSRSAQRQGEKERRWFYCLYFLEASALAWLTPPLAFYHDVGGEPWLPAPTANGLLPVWWTFESASAVLLGILAPSRLARIVGMVGFLVTGWALIILFNDWTWAGTLMIVACLYGLGHLYRRFSEVIGPESTLGPWYSVAATIVTTLCIGSKVAGGWISPAWALEGLLLLLAGFRIPDRWFRVSGLLVFALVMFKLLFVDLAGAATIQRILSFIGAGVVLLLSSYAYSKYATHIASSEKSSTNKGQG